MPLMHFNKKEYLSAIDEESLLKHQIKCYCFLLLFSSDEEIKTRDKLNISSYTPFKFQYILISWSTSSYSIDLEADISNNSIMSLADEQSDQHLLFHMAVIYQQ